MKASRLKASRTMETRLAIEEASFQAFGRSSAASSPVKTGMKAEPSAPPATRLKRISEKRLAAKKALLSMPVPNSRAVSVFASKPTRLLMIKAAITVPAARAIWVLALDGLGESACIAAIIHSNCFFPKFPEKIKIHAGQSCQIDQGVSG